MSKEEAAKRAENETEPKEVNAHNNLHHHHIPEKSHMDGSTSAPPRIEHSPRNDGEVEKTLAEAEKSTDKQTGKKGRRKSEEDKPDRTLGTFTNDARISATLPIVQEVGENGSRNSSRRGDESSDEKRGRSSEEEDLGKLEDSIDKEDHSHRQPTSSVSDEEHPDMVEYTVTDDDHHLLHNHHHEKEEHMQVPLDDSEVIDEDERRRRRSKPPRIESGIIPQITPMYGEDEIGIAK